MLNISSVFAAILQTFTAACNFLFSHGIQIGSFTLSFGGMAIALIVLKLILSFLPFFHDDGDDIDDGGDE